ncbi:hypothetical protein H0H93_008065 [Arthromyces matolae]|nr:hypothetical protein H0H93_008065 [Arthromyces matolae]
MSLPQPSLISGKIYKIISVADATIITLTDRPIEGSLVARRAQGGDKWTLENVATGNYLIYPTNFTQGSRLAVSKQHVEWDITQWKTRSGAEYRVWVPGGTELLIDLVDYGIGGSGNVQLFKSHDTTAQFWLVQRVVSDDL